MTLPILILGGTGQLGSSLLGALRPHLPILAPPHEQIDLLSIHELSWYVKDTGPYSAVINCAARHQIAEVEGDVDAFRLNAFLPYNIARLTSCPIFHMSTSYVFDGEQAAPYEESAQTRPINDYGKAKALAEHALLETPSWSERAVIFRMSNFYRPGFPNIVTRLLNQLHTSDRVSVVNDQWFQPTPVESLTNRIVNIIDMKLAGVSTQNIYHLVASGGCTPFEFASVMLRYLGVPPHRITPSFSPFSSVSRPTYATLANNLTVELPHWSELLHLSLPLFKDHLYA